MAILEFSSKRDVTKTFFPVEIKPLFTKDSDSLTNQQELNNHFVVMDIDQQYPFMIVPQQYRLTTNKQAYDRAIGIISRIFKIRKTDRIVCLNVNMPKSRSFCHIDLIVKSTRFSPWKGDAWNIFFRITNSYMSSQQLCLELGFCRWKSLNCIIFRDEDITFNNPINNNILNKFKKYDINNFINSISDIHKIEEKLVEILHKFKNYHLSENEMLPLFCRIFAIEINYSMITNETYIKNLLKLRKYVKVQTNEYFSKMGSNGYSALNVLMNYATLPNGTFDSDKRTHNLQKRVGKWVFKFVKTIENPRFSLDTYLANYRQATYLIESIPEPEGLKNFTLFDSHFKRLQL
jgi:hypothetical protein